MKVLVVADGHYYIDENSIVYADSVYDYRFFSRYIAVFKNVTAAVRLEKINSKMAGNLKCVSGPQVAFEAIRAFKGPMQYLKYYFLLKQEATNLVKKYDFAVFRIPGAAANLLLDRYMRTGKPFAVEVVVDPWEFFAPGTTNGITRPIIRYKWTAFLKKACRQADGVSYVTESYLQKQYPAGKNCITGSYSSVEIPLDTVTKAKKYKKKSQYIISHASSGFATYGKGHIPLMKAVTVLRERGYDLQVIFIGDGPLRPIFQDIAQSLDISKAVYFMGKLPSGNEVRRVMEKTDMFVFPTKAEGLPRVLLEAMASGLPCISTPVCGIPEILRQEYLADYDDYISIADKIERFINNPALMEQASEQNIQTALRFTSEKLQKKRNLFYQRLKDRFESSGS